MLLIAAILAHIYIGSVGMEGAFDAMGSGQVDINWAREHHSLWLEQEVARARERTDTSPGATKAGAG
jgi:formate dehydrogenase subunit gamma